MRKSDDSPDNRYLPLNLRVVAIKVSAFGTSFTQQGLRSPRGWSGVRRGKRHGAVPRPYGKQAVAFRGIFQLAKARLNATFTVPLT
jgi:hypothetical protein